MTTGRAEEERHGTKNAKTNSNFLGQVKNPSNINNAVPNHRVPLTVDPNAMEVDSTQKHGPPTCYNYNKVGHIAQNCHSPKVIKVVEVDEMTNKMKQAVAVQLHEQGF